MKVVLMFTIVVASLVINGAFVVATAAEKHDVSIKKFKFIPPEITVKVNDSIRWTNKEKRQYHSVWFEQLGEPEPDYFFPDEFFERTFDKAGDFPYRCGPHPRMKGIVHVVAGGSAKPVSETGKKSGVSSPGSSSSISPQRREEIISLLRQDCGACHGMTLQGGLGPSLLPDALKKMTEEQVALTISAGRPGTPMPPWKSFFSEQEMQWLAKQLKQGFDDNTGQETTKKEEANK
jgi:plastocyanin